MADRYRKKSYTGLKKNLKKLRRLVECRFRAFGKMYHCRTMDVGLHSGVVASVSLRNGIVDRKRENEMKQQEDKNRYTIKITIRLRPDEHKKLLQQLNATACRKLSDYLRKIIFNKPVVMLQRNQSLDELLTVFTGLKNELNAIGNNFNQSVKKLHTLDKISEMKQWIFLNETDKKIMTNKVEEIKLKMIQIFEQWSQK